MKIATITCHDVYNYGASLQAYALQNYLQEQGHDVEIIDYKPYYLTNRYNWRHIPAESRFYPYKNSFGIQCVYFLLKNYKIYATIGRKYKFDEFKLKYLTLTNRTYISAEELKTTPPTADLYIAGSDQIWNTSYKNGRDAAFYLDFGPDNIRRISYAASFAVSEVDSAYKSFVAEKLQRFDAVSIRERTGLEIYAGLLPGKKAVQVVDPVFLLDRQQWENMAAKISPKEKYVLVYDFQHDPLIKEHTQRIARTLNIKIYSLNNSSALDYADRNISDAGPQEFLAWLANAEIVISNSFHATAFAVLFHRPFLTFPLKGYNNYSRMRDFLIDIGLKELFAPEKIPDSETLCSVNWPAIDKHLGEKIAASIQYLNENVFSSKRI